MKLLFGVLSLIIFAFCALGSLALFSTGTIDGGVFFLVFTLIFLFLGIYLIMSYKSKNKTSKSNNQKDAPSPTKTLDSINIVNKNSGNTFSETLKQSSESINTVKPNIPKNAQEALAQLQSTPIKKSILSGPVETSPDKILIFDTETTGIKSDDEILQLSIINWNEDVIIDELFRPESKTRWTEASNIHGIYPRHVKDKPTFVSKSGEIRELLRSADVLIGYNINFDLDMLRNNGTWVNPEGHNIKVIDVMSIATEVYGRYSAYFGDKKWVKLTTAISRSKTTIPEAGSAHNSLYDSICTLRLYKKLYEKNYVPENLQIKIK